MAELVFHSSSRQQLDTFITRPSHALILCGPEGIGKSAVSRWTAAQLLALADESSLESYPYIRMVAPDGQSISIEAVRDLLQFTKLKVAGSATGTQRIALIEQADLLTTEAQNSLLKLLEEPPAGTVLMLTAANQQALLATIRSRAQNIQLQAPDHDDLVQHFAALGFPPTKIEQAYLMSGGLPGLMQALLEDSDEHPLALAAKKARAILQADSFSRLATVDILSKQKLDATRVLFMLQQMAQAAIKQSASKGQSNAHIARWERILHASYNAEAALLVNAQPKLVLTNLMLNL